MAIKYKCCQCDEDVTKQVLAACSQGPDARAIFQAPTSAVRGKRLPHVSLSVLVTCSNGHQCEYPCLEVSHE